MANKTFICTKADSNFTVNKVYTLLEDGCMACDNGFVYRPLLHRTALEWLEQESENRFKPYDECNVSLPKTFKVRCVRCQDEDKYFTVGNHYEITNCGITDDAGYFWSGDTLRALEDLNKKFSDSCFQGGYEFELVEEN